MGEEWDRLGQNSSAVSNQKVNVGNRKLAGG